ncbi:FAD:protein FMN transferase [Psychroflexus sp. YR1-1]|uniref:FAD:protein FMN transferase n=1 Tax=Psychroflexus aurantiacus TaxID=2709310 RepID=A0A6B3RBP4_9FLAO|nr:FAD:protein FMN transferase [Psychroflexus aurantiacus]NEV94931.1 FAD:protein FMN transferase [Psychroflexus aurantiacus]
MKYLLVLLSSFFLISCGESPSVKTLQGNALGTTYTIKYFSSEASFQPSDFSSLLDIINASMSTYIPDSDISKINAGNRSIVVDNHFQNVFRASKRIFDATEGYFDPSVGLLVNAYGFGPGGYYEEVTDRDIDSLFQFVGFDNLQLTDMNRIESTKSTLYLDFNAIAKGYTVDVFGDFLESKGSKNYLVEIGGEVKVKGSNLDSNSPWIIGIELPLEDGSREIKYGVKLKDESLATSGNYRKFRVDAETGQKYVHTINPKTGKSQKTDILSASVIADTCTDADAYATAFMAMGFEKAMEFLKSNQDLDVIFIYSDKSGNQKTYISEKLQDSVEEF